MIIIISMCCLVQFRVSFRVVVLFVSKPRECFLLLLRALVVTVIGCELDTRQITASDSECRVVNSK